MPHPLASGAAFSSGRTNLTQTRNEAGEAVASHICEACGGVRYKRFRYPTGWETRLEIERQRYARRKVLRNNVRYLAGSLIARLPETGIPRFDALRERALNRQWLSRSQLAVLERNLKYGARLFEGRHIRVCVNCGFGSATPMPSESELGEYYARLYWRALDVRLQVPENSRTLSLYALAEECTSLSDIKTSIEFGSADATLSRYFKLRQPAIEISVIEPAENWQRLLRGAVHRVYGHIREATDTHDLFLSSHSLEHVSDITGYLKRIVDMIAPGGWLVMEVPNSEEADVIFAEENPDYHIPHTYFFTPKSLELIADRHGLEVGIIRTFNRSYSQILGGIHNGIDGSTENPKGAYLRAVLHKPGG